MPSRLTDGVPVSTEWLNSLVDAINDLQGSSSGTSGSGSLQLTGTFIDPSSNMLIESGQHTGQVTGVDVYESSVEFRSAFADSDVIVIATPAFVSTSTSSGRYNRPFKAYASVGNITKTKFELSVFLGGDDTTFTAGKTVIVNYIAIGKKP